MSGLDVSDMPEVLLVEDNRPRVTVEPCVRFGYPHVGGVPVDSLAGSVLVGSSAAETAEDYDLRREDVIVACWYLARHGPRAYKRRWKVWLAEVETELWHGRYDVADPPSKEDA